MSTVDFTPLQGEAPSGIVYRTPSTGSVNAVYAVVFVGIGGAFALGFIGIARNIVEQTGGDPEGWPFVIARVVGIAAIVLSLGYVISIIVRGFARRPSVVAKLPAFAAANGLMWYPDGPVPDYPGAIFHAGTTRRAFGRLTTKTGRFVDLGNVAYTIPAGRTTATETWGYIAIRLDRALPHILLEATASGQDSPGALPVSVDRSQRLSLEGDFDRYFTLYCPADYETDALYILAPDLMALLIDEVGGMHVEIIDDWLFVYSPDDFSSVDEARYQRLFQIIDVVTAKALRQTRAYSDDHAGAASAAAPAAPTPQVVAPEGRRMVPGMSQYNRLYRLSAIVLGIMIAAFIIGAMALYFGSGAYWQDVQSG